jgi:hypothetical protein
MAVNNNYDSDDHSAHSEGDQESWELIDDEDTLLLAEETNENGEAGIAVAPPNSPPEHDGTGNNSVIDDTAQCEVRHPHLTNANDENEAAAMVAKETPEAENVNDMVHDSSQTMNTDTSDPAPSSHDTPDYQEPPSEETGGEDEEASATGIDDTTTVMATEEQFEKDQSIKAPCTVDDGNLSMLLSMGFEYTQSQRALHEHGGNLEQAVEYLLSSGGGSNRDDEVHGSRNDHDESINKSFATRIDDAMMYDSSDPWATSRRGGEDSTYTFVPSADNIPNQQTPPPSEPRSNPTQPLHRTWNILESTFQDFDEQHQLRRRTTDTVQNISQSVGQSAQDVWSNLTHKTQNLRNNLRSTCDQADVQAREASTHIRYAASSAKDSVCRANDEYRISEKLATVAVVGGATLIAFGNPRAGAGVLAAAGATLAAGEVMRGTSARSHSTFTRDYGTREGLHVD